MGQRGPKALPANVHLLRGNASKKSAFDLTAGVQPEVEIPNCPKHLLPEARKEWRRITPELQKLGLIAKIDRPALALYCQAWAWLVWHENLLQRDIRLAEQARIAHEEREAGLLLEAEKAGDTHVVKPFTGGDGFMLLTDKGNAVYNPHWVARRHYAKEVDKFLASFGMSPSSRGRVTPSSNQASLFPENAKGGFNDF